MMAGCRFCLGGSRSPGLGERFAETLRGAGAEVVVTARRTDRLELLANRSGSFALAGDIASPGADLIRELVDGAVGW